MSDATGEFRAVVASLAVVGIATLFLVLCVWPPPHHHHAGWTEAQQAVGRYNNNNNNNNNTNETAAAQQQGGGGDLSKPQPREACTKTPHHVSVTSAKLAHSGGANLLVDGLVAFRHTKAAAAASAETPEQAALDRKERARILSRLLDGSQQPPMKGGTLLVAIPEKDVGCEKLARVLYLLGSFYNLLVILALPENKNSTGSNNSNNNSSNEQTLSMQNSLKERLRCGSIFLTKDVLPDHRILCSSNTTGRVALARQLQRVELILEYDATVRQNLMRFGHTVVLYSNNTTPSTTTTATTTAVSMLGQTLL